MLILHSINEFLYSGKGCLFISSIQKQARASFLLYWCNHAFLEMSTGSRFFRFCYNYSSPLSIPTSLAIREQRFVMKNGLSSSLPAPVHA